MNTRGARPLRSVHAQALTEVQGRRWWSISNRKTSTGATQVNIYDEIGFFGVSAKVFAADLQEIEGDLEIHVNSPGGDVFDGIAIFNTLKNRQGTVSVVVDSVAASAASFIAQAASPGQLVMAPHSEMMIHDGFAQGIGNAADLRELADTLDRVSDNIASIYADRTGKPVDYWRNVMQGEKWYTAEEAVEAGLADRVGSSSRPQDSWDMSVFQAKKKPKAEKGDPSVDPDQDNDDDTTPEGDTDHDIFPPKKAKKKSAKGNRSGGKIKNEGVDNSPWDAAKAWANGAASDNPEDFYRAICAGEKTVGEPGTQDHWALPYRYTPDSAPNAAAVRNALGRLPQTHDLKNPDGVKAKLEGLMKKVNPDYEPGNKQIKKLAMQLADALKGVNNG